MTRRLFFGLAAGLLASLALAVPSQAGSVYVTEVSLTNNTGQVLNDLETVWTGTGGTISNVNVSTPSDATSAVVSGGNGINFTFPSLLAAGAKLNFTFENTATSSPTLDTSANTSVWSFSTGTGVEFYTAVDSKRDGLVLKTVAIPEPASLALLGIGLSGLFTVRRLLKRAGA